ncbi:MAG: type II secretion system protein [Pseudohongiellaceae bacterium]
MTMTKGSRGFTLIELIAVMIVSSILAMGLVSFIGDSVTGLISAGARNQLSSAGRIALDRIAMELHNAMPNSIRTTVASAGGDQCIEFVPVRAATNYLDAPFTGAGAAAFDVVDFVPDQQGTEGGYAVIYPNDIDEVYDGQNATTSGFPARGPIEEIDTVTTGAIANASTVTLVETHRFDRQSPAGRLFLVDQPVSFCVAGTRLYRYTNYGFHSAQPDEEASGGCTVGCLSNYSSAPDKMLVTDSIDNTGVSAFTVENQSLTRNAIVTLVFNLTSAGDSVALTHAVLSRSVP